MLSPSRTGIGVAVFFAGPIAVVLRGPELFSDGRRARARCGSLALPSRPMFRKLISM
jgi:hypothetical protein